MSGAQTKTVGSGGRRPGASLSNAEKIRRREAGIARIRVLLADGPMCIGSIAADLQLPTGTVYGYLCFMAEMGEACRTGEPAGRRPMWQLGQEDPAALETQSMRPHGAVIVPAAQVGMWRHWMDVALFGPAAGVAA